MPPRDRKHSWAVEFGREFRELREQRRWNLKTAAAHLNLNPTYVSMLEKGMNVPSIDTLTWYASVFGVTVTELVRRVETTLWEKAQASKQNAG